MIARHPTSKARHVARLWAKAPKPASPQVAKHRVVLNLSTSMPCDGIVLSRVLSRSISVTHRRWRACFLRVATLPMTPAGALRRSCAKTEQAAEDLVRAEGGVKS